MPNITRIDVRFATSLRNKAGTDGDVYIGIGGREFYVDSEAEDFGEGADRWYRFGEGSNVKFAARNDPADPQLLTEDLDRYPAYVRFSPKDREDSWHLGFVELNINPGPEQVHYEALRGNDKQWLGTHAGEYCYLTRV